MAEKNVKTICITVTPAQLAVVDELRRKYYRMNQSEVYRMLIDAGAAQLLGKQPKEA